MCNNAFARFFEDVSSHSITQDAAQSLLVQAANLRNLLIRGFSVDWEAIGDVKSVDGLYSNKVDMLPNIYMSVQLTIYFVGRLTSRVSFCRCSTGPSIRA